MSLFFDIGTGAGLAGASGVRPFLPPLLAGALARGDHGISFDHTPYSFLESPGFLAAVLAAAVVAYAVERRRAGSGEPTASGRGALRGNPVERSLGLVALALGALLFAGSLSRGHHISWPGLIGGLACAALGYLALAALFARARRRVSGTAASLLGVYADGISLIIAGMAIALPPAGILALIAFAILIVRARSGRERKYEGLRILR